MGLNTSLFQANNKQNFRRISTDLFLSKNFLIPITHYDDDDDGDDFKRLKI
jgi:hypothetical protein